MDPILLKPAEPATLATDSLLALQGIAYAIILGRIWLQTGRRDRALLAFVATLIFIAAFALCGAVSHGTTSVPLADRTWPPTVIFGGIAFFFLNLGVFFLDPQPKFRRPVPIFAGLLAGYFVVLVISDWAFLAFAGYQLLCSALIFWICRHIGEAFRKLARALVIGLGILLFAGMIQAAGAALRLSFTFGPHSEYLFRPHNDVFHLLAMIALAVMYRGLIGYYGDPQTNGNASSFGTAGYSGDESSI